MNNRILLSLLVLSFVTMIGCEASKGVGKDLENTGKNIQDAVDKNQ